ncbi:hypothetical protein Tfu_2319 [Thermobifida fusca YX]|uniref:DUF2157 domain-containing protein n=2 Tax=Thermobifida fusca TaxID=2021 RepID=A0A9P2T8G8_THEFU|nr:MULTISPECIES: hypothetical protein [Thermobifida]AAZ56352.1 hypothetical protein Tfu_2319 [Thermobifida fusca YX]EOR70599.1 hypothetical protein TM51_11903 [Thermobifida fusca TM51]MBO2531102.1 hypothetical protein [Thermobifida sp.]MDD6790555.1 hypothetical protein [Thermobifida fusca]PPS92151.1 hypothetical protein BH05_11590 [Thermobifida fusca]
MGNGRNTAESRSKALHALVAQGTLSAEQAEAVAQALQEAEEPDTPVRWAEIIGFIGGGLVFVGMVSLLYTWVDLEKLGQAVLLLTVAALAAGGGLFATGGRFRNRAALPPTRRRVGGTLFVIAALAVPTALTVALEPVNPTTAAALGLLYLALAVLAYTAAPTAVGLLVAGGTSLWALWTILAKFDLLDTDIRPYALSVVAVGLVWGVVSLRLPNPRTGLVMAAIFALGGAQIHLGDHPVLAYTLTAAIAVLSLVLYQWQRRWVFLVTGVLGITIAAPEAIWDWTDGAVSGALLMLIVGLVLLAASGVGIMLHRKTDKQPAQQAAEPPAGNAEGPAR